MAVQGTASVPTTKIAGGGGTLSTAIGRNKDVAIVLFLSLLLYLGLFPLHFPFDNQSTYLLSGLASSGYGNLSEDWVSNTKTPFFLFSRIIAALSDIGFPGGIRLLSFLLAVVFSASGLMIFRHCRPDTDSGRSASLMFVLILLTVAIYDQFMLRGMAGQYVLGMYLQPSEFGVFLILSVALFVVGRPILPYIFVAVAGVFHQSYLLVGAFLVISFFSYELFFGKRIREALIGSVAALAIVSPVLWYSYVNFSAFDAELAEQSRRIIAEYRIPHHADPMRWFDATQAKKILVIVLATVLSYFVDRRLTFVMASSAVLGALASLVALLLDSNTLYLLFPWRVSVVLMPLATIVLVLSIVRIVTDTKWARYITGRWASAVMILLAATLSATSLSGNAADSAVYEAGQATVGYPKQDREAEYLDLIRFVRSHEAEGQVYLHNPTRFFSFRIRSGAAAYVDFKSHPYRDVEVVEWWSRWQWAFRLFSGRQACDPSLLDEIGDLGITHIVIDKAHDHETVVACIADGSASTAVTHDNASYSVVQIAR